jgi:hypothetical protein
MSQTEPLPSVSGETTDSRTKLPSFLKTWIRLLSRSQTKTSPFLASVTQEAVRNCLAAGAPTA